MGNAAEHVNVETRSLLPDTVMTGPQTEEKEDELSRGDPGGANTSQEDLLRTPVGDGNSLLFRNPGFNRHALPLSSHLRLLEEEYWDLEMDTMNPSKYRFTTSQRLGQVINRYKDIFATEKTIFPPLPGTKAMCLYRKIMIDFGKESGVTDEAEPADATLCVSANAPSNTLVDHAVRFLREIYSPEAVAVASSFDSKTPTKPLYINGNLIDLKCSPLFVACQAPTPAGMSDFFETLYQYRIQLVIMLTKTEEDGLVKAERYWPEARIHFWRKGEGAAKGKCGTESPASSIAHAQTPTSDGIEDAPEATGSCQGLNFGNMSVSVDPTEPYYMDESLELIYRRLLVQPLDSTSGGGTNDAMRRRAMPVLMIHYTGWPDHGVPNSSKAFLTLFNVLDAYKGKQPVLVHCSAGIGRTGTFIGSYAAFQRIRQGCFTNNTLQELVRHMRQMRFSMVQRFEQYLYMYQVILEKLGVNTDAFVASLPCSVAAYQERCLKAALQQQELRRQKAKKHADEVAQMPAQNSKIVR